MGKEDADLVRVALQGRGAEAEQAFAGLVSRWKVRIHRFIWARVRSAHDAEDLAAETFVRAWKSLATLREPEHFQPWLFRIAWNRVRSHYEERGMKRDLVLPGQEALEREATEAPLELQADLQELLARLPSPSLQILHDKYENRMTYEEIARKEGVSVSTVRDRLMAARVELERTLSRTDYLDLLGKKAEGRRRDRAVNGNGSGEGDAADPGHRDDGGGSDG